MIPRISNWHVRCVILSQLDARFRRAMRAESKQRTPSWVRRMRQRMMSVLAASVITVAGHGYWSSSAMAQLPTGADVVAGAAIIHTAGPVMDVNASSARTIINWNQFNVGAGQTANFNLPDANSAILNRVTSQDMPSLIHGALNSNGQVFLVNPSGIMLGAGGVVNTNAFVASTFDIANDKFMAGGALTFSGDSTASIVNNGTINTGAGGAHLIANNIANNGSITSAGGNITLSGGGTVTLNNGVTYVQPTLNTLASGISPTAGLIQNTGTIRATGAATSGGEVYLVNPNGKILHDGTIAAVVDEATSPGADGLAASSTTGGRVQLEADDITLTENSSIDATGTLGGGEVLVGGDWQGSVGRAASLPETETKRLAASPTMTQATTVTLEAGAMIDASATQSGDGGKIVLWSDITNVDSLTQAFGTLLAKAGSLGGDGGQIETSGGHVDIDGLIVNAGSTLGKVGLWLLDPYNYTIDASAASTIGNALNTQNVTVTTASNVSGYGSSGNSGDLGDIIFGSGVNITKTGEAETTLTLKADRKITGSTYNVKTTDGALNVVLWSGAAGNGGGAMLGGITTRGGDLWVGGGSGSATWNGLTVGDGYATGVSGGNWNAVDWYGDIDTRTSGGTTGGDVNFQIASGVSGSYGLYIPNAGRQILAGDGDITIVANTYSWGSNTPTLTSTGDFTWLSAASSFGQSVNNTWYNTDGSTFKNVTIGKATNTANVTIGRSLNFTGDLNIYGGTIDVTSNITSSGTGDIFMQAVTAANSSIDIQGNILKNGGENSTLTLKGAGRVQVRNPITATNSGGMNVVLWSDYDGGDQGGLSINSNISTGGGHFWAGGSDTVAGSLTWNGLTVGNGGSVGNSGYNHNAMDLYGNIATSGGHVMLWAGNGYSAGTYGIGGSGTRAINSGAGDITLIADDIAGGLIDVTSTGHFTYKPNSNTIANVAGQLDFSGTISGNTFTGSGDTDWLKFNNYNALGGLTLGKASMTNDIQVYNSIDINGPIELLGASIIVNPGAVLDSTGGGTMANIVLHGSGSVSVSEAIIAGGGVDIHGNTVALGSSIAYTGDVSIVSDNSDINLSGALSKTGTADTSTLLKSSRHIVLGSGASMTTAAGSQNIKLWADSDNSGDGINIISSQAVATGGGSLTIGNGSTATIGGVTTLVGGDLYFNGTLAQALSTDGGDITINGETILANTAGVTFNSGGGDILFSGVLNSGNQYTGVTSAQTWQGAVAHAKSGNGDQLGDTYLATVTSRLENAIAGIAVNYAPSWLGGRRVTGIGTDSSWRWVTGPEGWHDSGKGLIFANGISGTTPVDGAFTNWSLGEPNNSNGESAVQFVGAAGNWNDLNHNSTTLTQYVRETNLTPTAVTINAGTGSVTINGGVGGSKALSSLDVTASQGININGGQVNTVGVQTYNNPLVLGAHTNFSTIQSDIIFNSTVDSNNAITPWNLTTTITPSNVYHWVDWTNWDAATKTATGTITVGTDVITVTYHNPQGIYEAQTSGGTNYWTGYIGGAFSGKSPYVSTSVANGPSTSDIIKLQYGGSQTLTFSESVENLAFSIVSMNGNGYGFDQNFTIEGNSGVNGAGPGYFGSGNFVKSIVGNTFQLNDGGVNGSSQGGYSEPHGTIRFGNAFSSLTWNSLSNEVWNAFTVGISGTSNTAGSVQFNGAVGGSAQLGAITVNGVAQTTANIAGASSFSVTGLANLGGSITTSGNQSFGSAVTLGTDLTLKTTSNGNINATRTINGAHNLTVQTSGTGDVTLGNAVGGTGALTGLTITTDQLNTSDIALAANAALSLTTEGTSAISGVISGTGATLSKAGSGSLTLSGTNTYSGSTTISAGTLSIAKDANLGTAPGSATAQHLTIDGATLLVTGNTTLNSKRGIELGVNDGTIDVNAGMTVQFGGIVDGSGDFSKTGAGKLSLSGTNTYTGTTRVSGGILEANNVSALGNNSALTLDNTAGVSLNLLSNLTIGSLVGGGTTGGNVSLGSAQLTAGANNTSTTYAGVMSGTGSLQKSGSGDFKLTANSSYTGATTIGDGQLILENNAPTFATSSINGPGALTIRSTSDSFSSAINTSGVPIGANTGLGALTIGKSGNTADITIGSNQVVNGNVDVYGGNIVVGGNITKSTSADTTVNLKASGSVTVNSGVTIGSAGTITDLVTESYAASNINGVFTGNGSLTKNGTSTLTLTGTQTYTGNTNVASGAVIFRNDVAPTTFGFTGSGSVTIEPLGTSFSSAFNSAYNFASTLLNLTIGKSGNTSNVTIGSTIDVTGDVNLHGGDIALNSAVSMGSGNVLTVNASGNVTQSAAVTTDSLLVLGTGNFTLNNASNAIGTVAGGSTGTRLGNVAIVNSGVLNVGTVQGVSGLTASDTVNVSTTSGDLTVAQNIATTNASNAAVTLNAGRSASAGSAAGGNLLFSGGSSVTVGAGGRGTLYSGSIADSTGLTNLVGSGSGRFRYNSDEAATNYSLVLGSGLYGIYRTQPTLAVTVDNKSQTYANSVPSLTLTTNGDQNGDTQAQMFGSSAITIGGTKSTSDHFTAGAHALTFSGTNQLGYADGTVTAGTLTVNAKTITIASVADSKTYDGTTATTFTATSSGLMTGDVISIGGDASFNDKNAGTAKSVDITGLNLTGSDAANYSLSTTTSTSTADITARPITVSGIAGVGREYDGSTVITLDGNGAIFTDIVSGDDLNVTSATGALVDKNVGTAKSVVIASTQYGGTDVGNYVITDQATTTAEITAKSISVSGIAGVAREYDGSTVITLDGSGAIFNDIVSGDDLNVTSANGALVDKNIGTAKSIVIGSTQYGGTDLGNYVITEQATTTAEITAKSVTVSGITGVGREYDGSTVITLDGSGAVFTDIVSGDDLNVTSATGALVDKNVGTAKSVVIGSTQYGGTDLGNYVITDQATTTAVITARNITITAPSVTKVYDGNNGIAATAAQLQNWSNELGVTGDTVTAISLNYNDKNVGTDKAITPSAISVTDGNGGGNYNITFANDNTSSITRLGSVMWIGGTTGDWSDPANWAGGAIPDLANVANVVIPNGVTPRFGSNVAGPVDIDSLTGGNFQIDSGTLNVADDATLDDYTQNGGIFNVGGNFSFNHATVNDGTLGVTGNASNGMFTQNGGTVGVGGNMDVTDFEQLGGTLGIGGRLDVTNSFYQSPNGTIDVIGDVDINHTNGDLTIGNLSGHNVRFNSTNGGVHLGDINAGGTLDVTAGNGDINQLPGRQIIVSGTSTFDATGDITLGNPGNDFVGPVNANGNNVTITDGHGGLTLGDITTTGTFNATSTDGPILQINNGTLTTVGAATFSATQGGNPADVLLTGLNNDFQSEVNVFGRDIDIHDAHGGLLLGNVTASGNFGATSTDGPLTQTTGSSVIVTGTSTLASFKNGTPSDVTLANRTNNFGGKVNVIADRFTIDDIDGNVTLGKVSSSSMDKQLQSTSSTAVRDSNTRYTPDSASNVGLMNVVQRFGIDWANRIIDWFRGSSVPAPLTEQNVQTVNGEYFLRPESGTAENLSASPGEGQRR